MWELINKNKSKTFLFVFLMALCFGLMAYCLAETLKIYNISPIWVYIVVYGYFFVTLIIASHDSKNVFLKLSNARFSLRAYYPKLFNIVQEMSIASGLSTMPEIYIIDEDSPNAFACGKDPQTASVVVTKGLLARLNRDELQAVVAHEISHIVNRDILYLLYTSCLLGCMVFISDFVIKFLRSCSNRRSFNGGAIYIIPFVLISLILVALSKIFYFCLSKKREYLADACAVQFTRNPMALANALKKIDEEQTYFVNTNPITSAMFIVSPLNNKEKTHPPIEKRIQILLRLSSCNIAAYNNSYKKVLGKKSSIVSKKIIDKPSYSKVIPIVATTLANQTVQDKIANHREAYDTMLKMENYIFIKCDCDTKLKVPKELKGQKIPCPHCKKMHLIK
ncbi:MAG: M48 family metallopeptidase [Candidatus Gastranaerophilales bacterium]|nr:M48 family metallopeptidase [Candidatus Gastranaerophilales bacterium]